MVLENYIRIRVSVLKLKFTQNILMNISEKPFHIKMQTFVCGVCDTFVSFPLYLSYLSSSWCLTLFSFQGTIFEYELFKYFKLIYADSEFYSTPPRMLIRKAEKKFTWCVKLLEIGGDEENRTPDPLLARQVLSQLSYTPKFKLILRHKQLAVHKYCLHCFFLVWT